MDRGKHCTEEKRNLIKTLRNQNKTYREIREMLSSSDQMRKSEGKVVLFGGTGSREYFRRPTPIMNNLF